jgi:hypothetical protein
MQLPTRVAFRALSIIAILVFLFSSALFPQGIVIKEKVEIAPKASRSRTITEYGEIVGSYKLAYPARVSENYPYVRAPEDQRSWRTSCNERFVMIEPSPNFEDPSLNCWYGGSYGIFDQGTELVFINVPDIVDRNWDQPLWVADGIGFPWPDSCGGAFFLYFLSAYPLRYVETDLVYITRANFCPPVNIAGYGPLSISYGESKGITIGLQDACGNTTQELGPTPVNYHVEITSGQEWATLYNQETEQTGDAIDVSAADCYASFTFLAREKKPDVQQTVVLEIHSDNPLFLPTTMNILVQEWACMTLEVTKPVIRPGDTTTIDVLLPEPLGENQTFLIRMKNGEDYGRLRCVSTGDEGVGLYGKPPFEFFTFDTISVDPLVVEIEAILTTEGGTPTSIGRIGEGDTSHIIKSGFSIENTDEKNINIIQKENEREGLELTDDRLISRKTAILGNDTIKHKFANVSETLKARLAYETAKDTTEKQKKVKQAKVNANESAECTAKTTITITKEEGCIHTTFATSPLSLGDTTTLQYVYTETNQPVPTDKLLDVSILSGDGSGWLLSSSGETNLTLNNAVQPIRYIAPKSIEVDSLLVYIKAVVSEPDLANGLDAAVASVSLKDTSTVKVTKLANRTEKIESAASKSIKGPDGKTIQTQPFSRAMINALEAAACLDKEAGTIEDPKFDPCIDETSLSGIWEQEVIVRDNLQDGGHTWCLEDADNGHPFYIEPVICENVIKKCYGLMIPIIFAHKWMVIGTKPESAIEVNSLSNVPDKKAKVVVDGLVKQLERINEILELLKNEPSPSLKGRIPINMKDVWSYTGILIHEKTHIKKQFELMVFEPTLKIIKEKFMPKCRPKSEFKGKSRNDIESEFVQSITNLTNEFQKQYAFMFDKKLHDMEFDAHREQFKFLKSLAKEIASKYGIPYNPPPIYIPE